MDNLNKPTRITIKLKQPNILFETWLKQWKNKAKEKGSKLEHSYSLALESLKKYPLPLKSGRDCKILYGFGDKLCSMLDKKLLDHNRGNLQTCDKQNNSDNKIQSHEDNSPTSNSSLKETNIISSKDGNKIVDHGHFNELNLEETDIKKYETGTKAILVAIYKCSSESGTNSSYTKAEIMVNLLSDTKSIAWAQNMNTLLSDHMITRIGKPYKFSLTPAGMSLAQRLYEKSSDYYNPPSDSMFVSKQSPEATKTSKESYSQFSLRTNSDTNQEFSQPNIPAFDECPSHQTGSSITASSSETIFLSPDTFDIILYVDTGETGAIIDVYKDPFLIELQKYGTLFEIKRLNVGDYTWICRGRTTKKELILPYIIERKRLDDFAKSIKDGRYHEQKYRLRKCGIQNIYYLIENFGKKERTGLPVTTLQQAAINTVIQDGFFVKTTSSLSHTAKYLADFTRSLISSFRSKTLFSTCKNDLRNISLDEDLIPAMVFDDFNESSAKNRPISVSDLFVKMLLQLKGMSVDKALAIVEVYPTPLLLHKAFENCDSNNGAKLLSDIQFGKFKKKIGPQLSKILYQLFTFETFASV